MSHKLSIRDLDLKDKRVLVRVDFNVPMEREDITDDSKIRSTLQTIQYILDHQGKVILLSHLGRPKGKHSSKYSLKPCAERLSIILDRPVYFETDCCGEKVEKRVQNLHPGDILLLENVRFHPGEENESLEPTFGSALSELGDVYVNDAFGSSHRNDASVAVLPTFFPGKAAMGLSLEKELDYLGGALKNPKRPFCAILGGSKISTKLRIVESLMQKADLLLIGGGMAFNFLKAEKLEIGDSLCEEDFVSVAREFIDVSSQSRCRVVLPVDFVIARQLAPQAETRVVQAKSGIPRGWKGLDIGPETIKLFVKELEKMVTVFWNGPMGVFEQPPFDKGTFALAEALSHLNATTIVGGGDSVAAIHRAGLGDKISHLSMGGGAALDYIEFGDLPGIAALSESLRLVIKE